jgi:hypothetical protein
MQPVADKPHADRPAPFFVKISTGQNQSNTAWITTFIRIQVKGEKRD